MTRKRTTPGTWTRRGSFIASCGETGMDDPSPTGRAPHVAEQISPVTRVSIAVIATLYFAVTKVVDGLNLDAVGVILMIVGGLGLVVSLLTLGMTRARAGRPTVVQGRTPAQVGTTVLQGDAR